MKPLNQWTFAEVMEFLKSVDKKIWMGIISGAAGFFLVLVFLVIPAWIQRPLLRRDIQSMEAQIRQADALNKKRPGWEENQKVFGALIGKTQGRLFTVDGVGLLLGQVSKMASESRVDVLTSKPLVEKSVFPAPYGAKYQPRGYEFTVQGGYHDLAKLTSRIESQEKLLRIKSLRIAPSGKMQDRHTAEFKLWAILAAPPPVAVPAKAIGADRAKK